MHVIFRILFWLSLAATCLFLTAPVIGGADWDAVQPTALAGLALTLLLAFASARALPSRIAADPLAAAARRRGSGIAYSIILMVVLGPMSFIALNEAQQDLGHGEAKVSEIEMRMREGSFTSPFAKTLAEFEVESAEAGQITAIVGLVAVGLALLGLIVAVTRKVPRATPAQPLFQASGAPYQAIVTAPYQQAHPQQGPYAPAQGQIWNESPSARAHLRGDVLPTALVDSV